MTDVNNLKILRIFSKVSLATVPIFDDWTLPGMVDSCPNSSTGQFPNWLFPDQTVPRLILFLKVL